MGYSIIHLHVNNCYRTDYVEKQGFKRFILNINGKGYLNLRLDGGLWLEVLLMMEGFCIQKFGVGLLLNGLIFRSSIQRCAV